MIRLVTRVGLVPGGRVHFVSDDNGVMYVYLLSRFPAKYQRAFVWIPGMYFYLISTRRVMVIYTIELRYNICPTIFLFHCDRSSQTGTDNTRDSSLQMQDFHNS